MKTKNLQYEWGDWKAEISKHPRRNEYSWVVYDKYGNDTYDFHSDINDEFKTTQEAENNMFSAITNKIGHLPKRK
tara:strand:- start:153 stop:377 length:225 start_codon:yes stop_codon:yes gene_type:complete